jgi:hypothetical protein
MSDISLLTILLNAVAVIKNRNGDASIHGYVELQKMTSRKKFAYPEEAYFKSLDCLSDILVQDTQVIAASYDDVSKFTLVTPSELDDDDDSDWNAQPIGLASEQESVNMCKSLHAAVVPNPDRKFNDLNCNTGSLGQIREVKDRDNLWIKADPLCKVVE